MRAHVVGLQPALRDEVIDDDLVGLDDAGEAAGLDRHVGERRALVEGHVRDAVARELEDLADPLPALEELRAQDVKHHVLRADAGPRRVLQDEARGLGNGDADVLRVPGVRHVGGADAEREAAERAGHARVRVGAGDELTGQRDLLDHLVVADGLRADELPVAVDLAIELHALALREVLLHGGELLGGLLEPHVAMGLRHDEIEERQVITKRPYGRGIGDARVFAHLRDEERLGHRRDVLVREANVGAREERIARLHRGHAGHAGLRVGDDVRGEDLLAQRHGTRGRGDGGWRDLAFEPRAVVREEAAVLDDRRADGVEALRELRDGDGLARLDARDEPEVRGGQQADVLGVLLVDLLDALRDDELHAGLELAVRRGLAARAAALRSAADDDAEAAGLDRVLADLAAAEADQAVASERLVVIVANPSRRELVGGDVGYERALRIECEVLSGELLLEQSRVLGDVEDPSLDSPGIHLPK